MTVTVPPSHSIHLESSKPTDQYVADAQQNCTFSKFSQGCQIDGRFSAGAKERLPILKSDWLLCKKTFN